MVHGAGVEPEFAAALRLVARAPGMSPALMALHLRQDPRELELRLQAATAVGWLAAEQACCGQGLRFSIKADGLAVLAWTDD